MKEVKEMPKDQQFVAVWKCNGKIWSNVVCWIEEENDFLWWDSESESWYSTFKLSAEEAINSVKYFVLE